VFPPPWDGGEASVPLDAGVDVVEVMMDAEHDAPVETATDAPVDVIADTSPPRDARVRDAERPKDATIDAGEPMDGRVKPPSDAGSNADVAIGGESAATSSGCSCRAAGSPGPAETEPSGAAAGLLLGLTFIGRRRRVAR
jgi:hypothetical protein